MDEKIHNLVLENRQRLSVTSCREVTSFNDEEVVLVVDDSALIIRGTNLRVEEVSKTSGDVIIMGESIDSAVYSGAYKKSKEGILRRMFK